MRIFEVDLSTRTFWQSTTLGKSPKGIINIDAEHIPVKWQREDCYCDWRLCNNSIIITPTWKLLVVIFVFVLVVSKRPP